MKNAWKAVMVGMFLPPVPPPSVPHLPLDRGKVEWSCDFELSRCDLYEQSRTEPAPRSFFVGPGRSGRYAVALYTEPGDDNVHGSGAWERNDFQLSPSSEYCNQGQEEWWALSILFPDQYEESELGTVMDFHNTGRGDLANFHIMTAGDRLEFAGFYGNPHEPQEYYAPIGPLVRNVWYDFVLHVKWTAQEDGLMEAWVNGRKMLFYAGPTLYAGQSCYLKLANYHAPMGKASMVVFDRVLRGTSAKAVSLGPLE